MVDLNEERRKRREATQTSADASQDVARQAVSKANGIARDFLSDVNQGSDENIQVAQSGRRVTLTKDVDSLHIDVNFDGSYTLVYEYGKKQGVSRPTVDRQEVATDDTELAEITDKWREIP